VRCGLHINRPNIIRLYLESGRRLLREGIGKPIPMYSRMLQTLTNTASDAALPPVWRHLCAEYFDLPLARLRTLLGDDPVRVNALISRAQTVRSQLPVMCEPPSRN